jgi:hypothetical protein
MTHAGSESKGHVGSIGCWLNLRWRGSPRWRIAFRFQRAAMAWRAQNG